MKGEKKKCSRSSDHRGKKKGFLFLYPETLLALGKTALLCPLTNGFIFSYTEFIISTQTCSLTPSQSLSHLKAVTYIIHKDNRKYAESYRHVMERLACIRSKFHVLHGAYDSPINSAAQACLHPSHSSPRAVATWEKVVMLPLTFYFFWKVEAQ